MYSAEVSLHYGAIIKYRLPICVQVTGCCCEHLHPKQKAKGCEEFAYRTEAHFLSISIKVSHLALPICSRNCRNLHQIDLGRGNCSSQVREPVCYYEERLISSRDPRDGGPEMSVATN